MSELVAREYSQRLGVLTPEQLQRALDRFDHGTLVAADPAPGGLFGQNVMLTTNRGEYVLRGCPHYDWQFPAERCFAQLIDERAGLDAPWPYEIDDTSAIFGWPYAIMPRLPGVNLQDPDLRKQWSHADRIEVARAMGDGLGRLQQLRFERHSEYDRESGALRSLEEPWSDWFIAWVRGMLDDCMSVSQATTKEDATWVESVIAQAEKALRVPFEPSIVHRDHSDGNVLAQRDGAGWRITGVVDLMECYAGDGEVDLARMACGYSRHGADVVAAYVQAYAEHRPLRDGFAERMRLYILSDRLLFWQYGQRNRVWFTPEQTLRSWAEEYVELPVGGSPPNGALSDRSHPGGGRATRLRSNVHGAFTAKLRRSAWQRRAGGVWCVRGALRLAAEPAARTTGVPPVHRSHRPRWLRLMALAALLMAGGALLPAGREAGAAVRYQDEVFASVDVTSNIAYGEAPDEFGEPQTLLLDLYQPAGDTETSRPVMIWVHGGGFTGGSKSSFNFTTLGTRFAKRGYVTASIEYRLREGSDFPCTPNSPPSCQSEYVQAILDAQHDAQAAIRWFRANAATYGIDTSRIAIGGHSAGGATALFAGYNYEDPGTSGNPGFDSTVDAVINLAAGFADQMMSAGDPPVMNATGTLDDNYPNSLEVCDRAAVVGVYCEMHSLAGAPHDLFTCCRETVIALSSDFLYDQLFAVDVDNDDVPNDEDNCPDDANTAQTNSDALIVLMPAKPFNDSTRAMSDAAGDACDPDDDNDGRSDADEMVGAGCGGAVTEPLVADSDGDNYLDGAECTLGANPNSVASRPTDAACGGSSDPDGDGVVSFREVCFYGTDPNVANSDGDACNDGREAASVNANQGVDVIDLQQVASESGPYALPATAVKANYDITKNATIDVIDLQQVAARSGGCP